MSQFMNKKLMQQGLADYDIEQDFTQDGSIFIDEEEDMPTREEEEEAAGLDDETDLEALAEAQAEIERLAEALDQVKDLTPEHRKTATIAVTKVCLCQRISFYFLIARPDHKARASSLQQRVLDGAA